MRRFFLLFLFLTSAFDALAEETIRAFPIPTIVALGKELHQRDAMAAHAFDAPFEAHPWAKGLPIRAWITQIDQEQKRVFLIQERDGRTSPAFIVNFPADGAPVIEDKQGEAVPENVATRLAARRSAIEAIPKFMTKSYNFEVLSEPDGKGMLVYALAATNDPNLIMAGGHYRVTVSPGGKVQQVDALSRSMLILDKHNKDRPEKAEYVGSSMTHIVSDTPVETHVFISLLHKIPLQVVTKDGTIWSVRNGEITKTGKVDEK